MAHYNNNCNSHLSSEHYKIGECRSINNGGSVYPLYINDEIFSVEFYFNSNRCNGYYEVRTFNTNQCESIDEENVIFSGYNDNDDDIHPVVATILGIASTLFCCCIFILLLRCCFVQNPFGRSQPAQPVVQMVPQNQLPQIMVQQPPQMVQPQMNHLNPHPNQQHQMVIQQPIPINLLPAVQATAPGEEQAPVPAYTYPHLNNNQPENNQSTV